MKILKAVICEDQLAAQRILSGYIEQCPGIQLVETCINPMELVPVLSDNAIDVIFLDIQLPIINGINFLKAHKNLPPVILTTAFTEYAIESFDLDVCDYLLKPFSFERFIKAIDRLRALKDNSPEKNSEYIFIKEKGALEKIAVTDIQYLEARGDITLIHVPPKRHVISKSLKHVIALSPQYLLRCHKSYAVNLKHINRIVGNSIIIGSTEIPIGRAYREEILEKLRLM